MARRLIPATVPFAAAAALLAGACAGPSDELDAATLVAAVPAALVPEAPEVVTDVVCPAELERGVGVVVSCEARVAGRPITLSVEQVDDAGRVSVATDAVLLDTADLAADLAARLQADLGVVVGAVCAGPRVVVPAAGDEVTCTANDEAGRPLELVATLLDAAGAYEVRPS
jgi:hypothetical protein